MGNPFKKRISIMGSESAEAAFGRFSVGEKAVFVILMVVTIVTGLMILGRTNDALSIVVPAKGGTISEGTVGSPRFINPLLAISDADRDLTALVFSGLLRSTTSGVLEPDLAENYTVSDDGLVYTVKIKDDAVFHDGSPITADDVIFTVNKAKDPSIKSPRRAEWEGVTAEKVSDKVVAFHLSRPYYPFIENLTLGIVPRSLWKDVSADEFAFSLKNISPIGSGPYKIAKITKNDQGIPTSYELHSFDKYARGEPYISKIVIKIYTNTDDMIAAWKSGLVGSMGGISPQDSVALKNSGAKIEQLNLPRIYGVFFNQNQQPIFVDQLVREALDVSIDKEAIVKDVLLGYGSVLEGPLPNELLGVPFESSEASSTLDETASSTARINEGRKLLSKAGWKLNPETNVFEKTDKKSKTTQTLSFDLYSPNVPELKNAANMIIETWKELGASVDLKLFEISDLTQNIIRPRKYDALLFGEVIGRNPDLFAFWHSSQRNDPGYNIALYTNSKVDAMLNDARQVRTADKQTEIMRQIFEEINKDSPAIFLYSPDYLYVRPSNVEGFTGGSIASPAERFSGIKDWHVNNQKVWEIFAKTN